MNAPRHLLSVSGEPCFGSDPARPGPRTGRRLSFGAASVARIGMGVRRPAGASEERAG